MTKAELAQLIDAYADSKASGNKYLVQKMIQELEAALNEVCDMDPNEIPPAPEVPTPDAPGPGGAGDHDLSGTY
jgi:hypothetical protein